MKTTNLLIIGGAVVLGGLYLTNKSKKDKAEADARALAEANALAEAEAKAIADAKAMSTKTKPVNVQSNYYTTTEATKKALEVVTKWISLLDAIPKEFLTQENRNIINQRIFEEKAKQDKIDYDKALAQAKLKKLPKFTFQGITFWTANQEDIRNGSYISTGLLTVWKPNSNREYFVNQFSDKPNTIASSAISASIKNYYFFDKNYPATLGDYIKQIKGKQFSELYDILKVVFTELPKSDVNRLVVMLPKYLMASSDDFDYFRTQYEKNPFTIEEQLYLKDINLEGLLSNRKQQQMVMGELIRYN